jgi:glycosyltransferase involved in cell wall biosynthesis
VPNGVDISRLPDALAMEMTRGLLGEREGPADLLHVGSVIPRKRVDVLLTVFAGILRLVPEARLIRVGGPFTEAQQAQALTLGVRDRIVELPPLDRRMLAAIYSRSALLISTSEREGFGLPLAESLAAGTPLLVTDIPVFREVAGGAATYVPLGHADEWVQQAVRLLAERREDPGSWERRRTAAQQRAARFSWHHYAREMTGLYRSVAGQGAGAP